MRPHEGGFLNIPLEQPRYLSTQFLNNLWNKGLLCVKIFSSFEVWYFYVSSNIYKANSTNWDWVEMKVTLANIDTNELTNFCYFLLFKLKKDTFLRSYVTFLLTLDLTNFVLLWKFLYAVETGIFLRKTWVPLCTALTVWKIWKFTVFEKYFVKSTLL